MTLKPVVESRTARLHDIDNPTGPHRVRAVADTFEMAAVVASGHVPPAPVKEQVTDQLPKRFKEMKFGIQ